MLCYVGWEVLNGEGLLADGADLDVVLAETLVEEELSGGDEVLAI